MDLIIKDDEGRILYGHQLITLIMASGNKSKVTLCDGIEAEAFIACGDRSEIGLILPV